MLVISRNEGESWRDCAARYGERYGLKEEVLVEYDNAISAGAEESQAAWEACCEWDILDYRPEPSEKDVA